MNLSLLLYFFNEQICFYCSYKLHTYYTFLIAYNEFSYLGVEYRKGKCFLQILFKPMVCSTFQLAYSYIQCTDISLVHHLIMQTR